MEIEVARNSGFCFGVKEAINKTFQTIEENKDKNVKIFTYGPLIHNTQVIESLKQKGIECVDALDEVCEGSIVIVRSHGVPESFYDEAQAKDLKVVDATCKYVRKVQQTVKDAKDKGYNIVIVGDKLHPEVIGINGWCQNSASIVENEFDAQELNIDNICIVAQTTITKEMWDKIIKTLQNKDIEMIQYNTICSATETRQKSCEETAKKSDAMIIIGGQNSSNSQKLYQIAKKYCQKTYFIETKEDLPLYELQKYNKIGIAAGASTPEWIIKEVITIMSDLGTDPMKEAGKEENQMFALMGEIEKSLRIPGRGEIVKGEIIQVRDREIIVNLGCKKDGIIPRDEISIDPDKKLSDMFNAGDQIEAKVLKTDDGEGNLLLSKKKLEVNEHWDEVNSALENKSHVNAKVTAKVKGGVIATYKEISGFIPLSQLSDKYVEKVEDFIGKVLPVKVTQVNPKRNKAVFSHRAFLFEEKNKKADALWSKLNVGDIVEGTVMRFVDYGAFIDIGGIDGLLHISEISWGKIKHPSDALKLGQKIHVKILSLNREKEKVSLGLKQTTAEPWENIDNVYHIGDIIEGKVVQLKEYGAFVEIEPGMDGLVHISEIAYKHVVNPANELKIGQIVSAKILDIDKENKRISLSIKETLEKPEEPETAKEAVTTEEAPAAEIAETEPTEKTEE